MKKIFQNLRVRLKLSIRWELKMKLFVTCRVQYFELRIFSFNSYVYYLSCSFNAPICAFNLLTCVVNLPTRALERYSGRIWCSMPVRTGYTKIRAEHVIRKRWLRSKNGTWCSMRTHTHTRIRCEYTNTLSICARS